MSAPSSTDPTSRMKIVCVPLRADRNVVQALEIPDNGVDRHHRHEVADADVTRWADRVAGTQRPHHLVRRHVVGTQLVGIEANDDGALAPAEGRRRRDAWQGREQRAHLEERRVLKLGDCFRLAGEDEVADRHAAGVEPHHERRHGSRGHEGAGAVDVGDRLGHGLRHVGAGMELELDQRHALDRFALDVLDAGDVEEVVLVIVDDEPFHLRRVHAAVGLGHVQHGHPEIREDVPRHAIERQKTHQCNGYDHHQKRDRASQCKRHQVHRAASARCRARTTERVWPTAMKLWRHLEEIMRLRFLIHTPRRYPKSWCQVLDDLRPMSCKVPSRAPVILRWLLQSCANRSRPVMEQHMSS